MLISHEELLRTLSYDRDEGVFRWLKSRKGIRAGQMAGCDRGDGYIEIMISKRKYFGHRLAWFYEYGEWPKMIDHVNRDPSDNRLCNLRLATSSQNMANRAISKCNKLGIKGVSRNGSGYRAVIKKDQNFIHLGTFKTPDEAGVAYKRAALELFGEFASF